VKLRVRIGSDVTKTPSKNLKDFLPIKLQPATLSLTKHPSKRNLRQAALGLGITAAHIRMHACKPHLFYVLTRQRRFTHQILPEERPPLINRDRVTHDWNVGKLRSVRQIPRLHPNGIENPSHRTDRIPHAEKVRRTRDGKCALKTVGNMKFVGAAALEKPQSIRNESLIARTKQPKHMQHSAQRASRVSAATESKHKNAITRLEFAHQKRIRIRDVVRNAIAEREPTHPRPHLAHGGERVPGPHRADAGMVVGDVAARRELQCPVEFYDIRVRIPVLVPGSVAADHNVSGHVNLRNRKNLRAKFSLPALLGSPPYLCL
jgi:hypothetical protein